MKKLRKTFALIMALVMLAGVFTFAAPTALADDELDTSPIEYTDHDDINGDYETAIQVFSKMKVIEGIGGNTFNPRGNLTRAAGAAMLSRTLLSRDGVDQFGSFGTRFRDLPVGEEHHWMVGPIAYMDSRGIMAGVGDNMFAPTDELTKIQWVRMMLSTLGYGANDEFVGPGWDSNVLRFAMQQDIDIFGIFNGDPHPSKYTNQNRLVVPRNDLTDPIAREEAIALLFNIVTIIEKVTWNGLQYTYNAENDIYNPTAGGVQRLIMGDIGLDKEIDDCRDHYGRPLDWTANWIYLNEPLVNTDEGEPERWAEESVTPNMSGVYFRTLLQGDGRASALEIWENIDIYVNGELQNDPDVALNWFKLTSRGAASETSLPTFVTASPTSFTDGTITDGTFNQYYSVYGTIDTAYGLLEAYLDGRNTTPAFGPSVKVEMYKAGDDIDILLISYYLTELKEKRTDDVRTLLVDESALIFDLFDTTTRSIVEGGGEDDPCVDKHGDGAQHSGLVHPQIKDIPELSLGWDTINTDWAVGSNFISTPYGSITPNGITTAGNFNKIYEPARVISGIAGNSTDTWIYLGDTRYDIGIVTPTVHRGDSTNNYDFYLNEDDVIIGAKYTAPGRSTISGYLYLATATGLERDGREAAWAKAEVILGGGPSVIREVNLRTRSNNNGQVWHPYTKTWELLPLIADDDDGNLNTTWTNGGAIVGIPWGWYSYTRLSDGSIQLGKVEGEPGYQHQSGQNVNIQRGRSSVGLGTTPTLQASTRTLLARMTGTGTIQIANFNNFPNIEVYGSTSERRAGPQALYKLEPNSTSRVAEVFYLDLSKLDIEGGEIFYGYLKSAGTGFGIFDVTNEANVLQTLNVTAPLYERDTLFYRLVDDGEGEYVATGLYESGSARYVLRKGYIDGAGVDEFTLTTAPFGAGDSTVYDYHEDFRMPIVNMHDLGADATFAGYNTDIGQFDANVFIVIVYDRTDGAAVAAFAFNERVDQTELAGLNN